MLCFYIILLYISMQIFSEECDTKKNNGGGALFGGGALYGENTVSDLRIIGNSV